MSSKVSLIPALLTMKCPRCRKGKVFKNANPYRLSQIGEMHDLCPVCSLNFRPEPGFYFGGAVVSYPLMVIYNLFVAIAFYLVVGDLFHHVVQLMLTLIVATILVAPVMFRYSRIIFLFAVVRYNKDLKKVAKEQTT